MNILVAMNSPLQLQLVYFFLSKKIPGAKIAARENLEGYLGPFGNAAPDVIILSQKILDELAKSPADLPMTRSPRAALIVIAQKASSHRIKKARQQGALGYLTHQARAEELLTAIHETSQGKFYYSSDLNRLLIQDWIGLRTNRILAKQSLDDHEFEVLLHYTRGMNVEQIAKSVRMPPAAVDLHMSRILRAVHGEDGTHQN